MRKHCKERDARCLSCDEISSLLFLCPNCCLCFYHIFIDAVGKSAHLGLQNLLLDAIEFF